MDHVRARLTSHSYRGRDISVALFCAVASTPAMAAAAVAVRLQLGGPVLFRQQRPGLHGRPFTLIKFRTMRLCNPSVGITCDADRMTVLGRFLRSTSLDELPTLWNVLRGEMSLVGPRPLLMEYLDRYSPEQARRHQVRPGITGWAQVNGRNALGWDERLAMDVWYVDNRTFKLDLVILWRTVAGVLRRSGVSAEGHPTMPAFQGAQKGLGRFSVAADGSGGDANGRHPRG